MKVGSRSVDRYVLVGLFNTALDLALFTALAVGVGLAAVLSNAISTVVVMTVSFFVNRAWVFQSQSSGVGVYLRFAGVTLFTGLLVQSGVILAVLFLAEVVVPALSTDLVTPAAKVVAMGTGMVVNFLGYRWLFSTGERSG
ncbi:GtrA family protein [Nocardioides sp. Y6]|uniref:GtrA family protein n=1 Tax=Nocardioides malaquae TaxID=2773426 RepID=A0ABR9RW84_9ACTN|nr:GtrA family protein [Nocardioides malaquae]MBE7325852.1 GtrA family protein [Nocardioides malaquae]